MPSRLIALGSLCMALAVAAGAFGAHGLKQSLSPYSMEIYEKAVLYHFIHAIGLLLLGLVADRDRIAKKIASIIGWLLFFGILLFSGSLYALAITDIKILGAITPFGGTAFIIAWVLFAYGSLQKDK